MRLFTSSTFTDMILERNILMEHVYPKIKQYCRDQYGIEFQVNILMEHVYPKIKQGTRTIDQPTQKHTNIKPGI